MIDDARSQRFAHHTELESYRSGHNEAVLKTLTNHLLTSVNENDRDLKIAVYRCLGSLFVFSSSIRIRTF